MSQLVKLLQDRLQLSEPCVFFQDTWHLTSDLQRDADRVTSLLREAGITTGDRVLLSEINSYGFLAVYLGILMAGAVVVPVNPEMPIPELFKVSKRASVRGAFVAPSRRTLLQEAWDLDLVFIGTLLDDQSEFALTTYRCQEGQWQLMKGNAVQLAPMAMQEEAGAILLFTSGTTGEPKGVLLTHRQVYKTVQNVILAHQLTKNDIVYAFLPLFHINAQVIGFLSTMVSQGKIVLEKKFSASRFWTTVCEMGITWISAVPTVIGILNRSQHELEAKHNVRFVRTASAALPQLEAKRFETRFSLPIVESYGMTEAASQICVNPLPPGLRKLGSVGIPVGIDLAIKDDEGRTVPRGTLGEITIAGESVIDHYASGEQTGKSFLEGYFYTGDIGYQDKDGYVFITGRKKEMINRAGQKISPREVEEVIAQDANVQTVAVIGLPDPLYGERVVAYVTTQNMPVEKQDEWKMALDHRCRQSISSYKCPVEYQVVDQIPVGPTGKIQRTRLKQQVLAVGSV